MRENNPVFPSAPFLHEVCLLLLLSSGSAAADTVTKVTTYEYDSQTGLVVAMVQNPDDPKLNLRTQYTYDRWDNRSTTVVSSTATGTVALPTRTVKRVDYRNNGESPYLFTNALGQQTTVQYTPEEFPLYLQNLNGLQTELQHDALGRVTFELQPDYTGSRTSYEVCTSAAPCGLVSAAYVVSKTAFGGSWQPQTPTSRTYYDSLGRVVRKETVGFDGTLSIRIDTEYDNLGRIYRASRPYYIGQPIKWTVYKYDVLGRLVEVTGPDDTVVRTEYSALTTTTINALNQRRSTTRNSSGQPILVTDDAGHTLQYRYDAAGRLVQTVDPKGNTVTRSYDVAGNMVSQIDPDLGTIRYTYDGLSQLRERIDAKGQVTTYHYDLLGRMVKRAEPDLVSTWTYDSCPMGKGKLCANAADNGYTSTIRYDGYGRLSSRNTTSDQQYYTQFAYDQQGRLSREQYPSGFAVAYNYTSVGYLKDVRFDQPTSNVIYWQANSMDAEGHVLEQTYGNNVVSRQEYDPATGRTTAIRAGAGNAVQNHAFSYDKLGNLLTRSDTNQSLSESFFYDNLNRLTSNTVNSAGAGLVTQTYVYDSIGNITSRSDAGTYAYGAVNARPHAVTQITRADGGTRQFSYDEAGNLNAEVERDAADNVISSKGRSTAWTSFNMPLTITNPVTSVRYAYGPEHQRIKAIYPGYTTYYLHPDNVGGLAYEKDVRADGKVEHRHFITAGSAGVVAMIKQDSAGTRTVSYLHRDYLGSTTAVTDASGAVIERMAYEPFGKRRVPAGALDQDNVLAAVNTNRGYTNHEQLDSLDLIHMNGRVYDPTIGRFISADPTVPAPHILQSYNRYSYVRNNPLYYIDPTGFEETPGEAGEDAKYRKENDGKGKNPGDVSREAGGRGEVVGGIGSVNVAGTRNFATVNFTGAAGMTRGTGLGSVGGGARGLSPAEREVLSLFKIAANGVPLSRIHTIFKILATANAIDNATDDTNSGDKPNLLDDKGEIHVLDGDSTGGGHRPGTGKPGKSEFPSDWSDDKIKGEISDVATDPNSTRTPGRGGRTIVQGTRDGIDITVVVEPGSKGGRIVTGFPTNVPRNPK